MIRTRRGFIGCLIGTAVLAVAVQAAYAANQITIGAIVPSSGPFAEWGRANTVTLKMLEKQVNDAGGINGTRLNLVILDDGAKPAQAANDLRKLADDDDA
ncbi:MAG: ABC transporter substrate-binding protein, partial [Gemmataceae bacterium]